MSKPRWKPRFRISLRVSMFLVLVLGGLLGWKLDRARTQARAVAAIKAADGQVFYDYQFSGVIEDGVPKVDRNARMWAPDWLRNFAGDEMFRDVTSISFHGDCPKSATWESVAKLDRLINVDFRILDAKLSSVSQLRSLPRLKSVTIGFQLSIDPNSLDEFAAIPGLETFTAMTWLPEAGLKRIARAKNLTTIATSVIEGDASLTALADLSQLKSLVLDSHAMFSGVGLKSLAPMLPQLERLDLSSSVFTDQDLLELSACRNLKYLKLENFGTTQAGIAPLKDLKTLETLDLQGSVSDDDSLSHLRGLVNLKNLVIDGSKVTDSGLASLVDLKKLEWLSLGGDELTDKGLDQIRKLQSLKTFWIRKSWKVTPEALASIRQGRADAHRRGFSNASTQNHHHTDHAETSHYRQQTELIDSFGP